ncbi:hypothetical protein, partial [Streptomyces sp. WAC02707]|uniref:hypothetical protein n=1 Tax=Streptomyces sp. WAC02707 TaxID=2487417 RepID=UPI001C8D61CF
MSAASSLSRLLMAVANPSALRRPWGRRVLSVQAGIGAGAAGTGSTGGCCPAAMARHCARS